MEKKRKKEQKSGDCRDSLQCILPSLRLKFNQKAWNFFPLQGETNCYAYALNEPRTGWARPGNLSSMGSILFPLVPISTSKIRKCLLKDGLLEITEKEALSGKFHAVALRIYPQTDFHFYRRDSSGLWSHKMGQTAVRRLDDDNRLIKNPRLATSWRYSEFGGYFAVPKGGILYKIALPDYIIKYHLKK